HGLAVAHDPHGELGNVHLDVEIAEGFGGPAPAFHVGDDVVLGDIGAAIERSHRGRSHDAVGREPEALLEGADGVDQRVVIGDVDNGIGGAFGYLGGGDGEAGAQQRHALVLHAELQHLAVGNGDLLDRHGAVVEL